ncbi:MAG: hypothetical protein KAV82_00170 [Phycisphaerae bacterium]|nr:hypothetical protein [Phycisphaerae bacterium]
MIAKPNILCRCGARLALACLIAAGIGACERKPQPPARLPPPVIDESLIDFPPEMHADDPVVNQFVGQVIETCVKGDYEKFRLLWTVREDPFPRQEFQRGWNALQKLRVLALQKMKTSKGQYLYSLHVRAEFDDTVPEPQKELVLLIVKEDDQWRLANAPAHHRKKILGSTAEDASPAPGDGLISTSGAPPAKP